MEQKKKLCDGPPPEDTCRYSEQAAEGAVRRVFSILGVDVDDPESVEKFRDSLRFGKAMHQAASKGAVAFISAFGGVLCYFIVELITGRKLN